MIFAELQYPGRYEEAHDELLAFVRERFAKVQAGLQGDSWIWIFDRDDKVAIDTFSSMKHQVKSARPGRHVKAVIDALRERYSVNVYAEPEGEPHDD